MTETAEDILAVKGWYTLADFNDPNTRRVFNQDEVYVTSIYIEDACISVKSGDTTVAMPDLVSAYSWVISNMTNEP
jgi:hypothetical protein